MEHHLCLVATFFLVSSVSAGEPCPAVIRSGPEIGGPSVYHDIDVNGNLVEIDYPHATERIIRHGVFGEGQTVLATSGFLDVSGNYTCLFVRSSPLCPSDRFGRWFARLARWDQSGNFALSTNILMNHAGDWAVLPIDRQKVYVQYGSPQGRVMRTVFDPYVNKVVGEFNFDLRDTSLLGCSQDRRRLYVADSLSPVVVVDAKTDRENGRVSFDKLNGETHDRRYAFVVALSGEHALIKWKYPEQSEMRLWLYDLDRHMLLAQSERMPFLYGRFTIERDDGTPRKVGLVAMEIVGGKRQATGALHTFTVEGEKIAKGASASFDSVKEIPLVHVETGKLVVAKRRGIGHFSILHVESFLNWTRENPLFEASEVSVERAIGLLSEGKNRDASNTAIRAFCESIQYKPDEWTRVEQTTNNENR